jgi:hypothetical protein
MPQMMSALAIGAIMGLAIASACPAFAQDTITAPQPQPEPQVERIDRVAGVSAPGGLGRAPEGVRVVAPGALVFASFDRNSDGKITEAEIAAGADAAFAAADKNHDGQITGFEQSDWAASIGNATDVMANAMTFDIDLDRSVTKTEFLSGLKRIANQIQPSGDLMYADLLRPLTRPSGDGSSGSPSEGWAPRPPRKNGQ